MIVNNGALIKTKDGHTHVRHLLPAAVAQRVLAAMPAYRHCAALVFDRRREGQIVMDAVDWDDPIRGGYLQRNREYIAEMRLEDALTEDPIQVMFSGAAAAMREVNALLQAWPAPAEFALAYTEYVARDLALVDVIHAGCSKGAALAEWARLRGLTREEVMAIGDNHNDRDMLEFAGVPVVMGNSVPELRASGWRVTLTNDECGVAAAIAEFALR
jgi:hypothetical protein